MKAFPLVSKLAFSLSHRVAAKRAESQIILAPELPQSRLHSSHQLDEFFSSL
jgi:hypothetical protein